MDVRSALVMLTATLLCGCGFDSEWRPRIREASTDRADAVLDVDDRDGSPDAGAEVPDADAPESAALDVVALDADVHSADALTEVACGAGLTRCAGECADTATSATHCGACGRACASGQACERGACVTGCAPGQLACGTICVAPLCQ